MSRTEIGIITGEPVIWGLPVNPDTADIYANELIDAYFKEVYVAAATHGRHNEYSVRYIVDQLEQIIIQAGNRLSSKTRKRIGQLLAVRESYGNDERFIVAAKLEIHPYTGIERYDILCVLLEKTLEDLKDNISVLNRSNDKSLIELGGSMRMATTSFRWGWLRFEALRQTVERSNTLSKSQKIVLVKLLMGCRDQKQKLEIFAKEVGFDLRVFGLATSELETLNSKSLKKVAGISAAE